MPQKIVDGRKIAKFAKQWQKGGWKVFYNNLEKKP
jgi:hypothetical protein